MFKKKCLTFMSKYKMTTKDKIGLMCHNFDKT